MKAAVLLAAATLAGCATMTGGPAPRGHQCDSSDCVITVTVTGCTAISVDRPWVEYDVGKKGDLEWRLAAAQNWEFTGDPIEFKSSSSNSEFEDKRPGPKRFKLKNKHTRAGQHDYNIWVTPDNGKTRCKLDPTIMNK